MTNVIEIRLVHRRCRYFFMTVVVLLMCFFFINFSISVSMNFKFTSWTSIFVTHVDNCKHAKTTRNCCSSLVYIIVANIIVIIVVTIGCTHLRKLSTGHETRNKVITIGFPVRTRKLYATENIINNRNNSDNSIIKSKQNGVITIQ